MLMSIVCMGDVLLGKRPAGDFLLYFTACVAAEGYFTDD